MIAPQCTLRRAGAQHRLFLWCPSLSRFELGVALDELLRAAARKIHGDAAVFFVAFDAYDGADAVAGVANFPAKHWIGIGAAFCGRSSEGAYGCSGGLRR